MSLDRRCWDAIVVGGGPAGSAVAYALASAGREVLLVERRTQVEFKFGELFPPQGTPLLARFGLDKGALTAEHAVARGTVSVWGSARPQSRDFLFNPYGDGLRLDRPRFDACLRERAEAAGASVVTGFRFVDAVREAGLWRVTLAEAAASLRARVLVDCSGRASVVARHLGVERETEDRLVAYGGLYASEGDEVDPFLRIEACPNGWLYGLQLPSGDRLVVFHTDGDLLERGDGETLERLVGESEHIGSRLRAHGHRLVGRARGAVAGGARLKAFCGPGWYAAGDAALAFDPLSSQGMVRAIESGFLAADCILAGHADAQARYVRAQQVVAAEYQRQHAHFYGVETRWAGEPFWDRRRGGNVASADPPETTKG